MRVYVRSPVYLNLNSLMLPLLGASVAANCSNLAASNRKMI